MNVTLHCKDFADEIRVFRWGDYLGYSHGPEYSHKCHYKAREREISHRRGEGTVTVEAEIGMMYSQIKDHQQPPEIGRDKAQILP